MTPEEKLNYPVSERTRFSVRVAIHDGASRIEWIRNCTSLAETQNGIYRVDMTEAEDGGIAHVLAVRERGGKDIAIGRFVMTDDGLRPDFGPENGPKIEHHIRTVRDLNGAIGSLASVACVFQEQRAANTPEP